MPLLQSPAFVGALLITFAADRATKSAIGGVGDEPRGPTEWLWQWGRRPVGLVRYVNRSRARQSARWELASLVALVVLLAALERGGAFGSPVAHAALGAAVGGAIGNVHDRLRHGAVVDFIAVGRWPAFNVADVAIVVGVVATLLV